MTRVRLALARTGEARAPAAVKAAPFPGIYQRAIVSRLHRQHNNRNP
jgi:hypothetical protein